MQYYTKVANKISTNNEKFEFNLVFSNNFRWYLKYENPKRIYKQLKYRIFINCYLLFSII